MVGVVEVNVARVGAHDMEAVEGVVHTPLLAHVVEYAAHAGLGVLKGAAYG